MTKGLTLTKKYRRYYTPGLKVKWYVPIYRGQNILLTRFPPTSWTYDTASKAQAHAERYAERKKKQNARFRNKEYRQAVVGRYAYHIFLHTKQEETLQIESDIATKEEDEQV